MTPPQDHQETATETYESLAQLIDMQLLDPMLTSEEVLQACNFARENGVRAVVVRPCDVELVRQWLSGSSVVLVSVAGYPDGTSTTGTKLFEGRDLLRLGAREIEFVLNPARLISRQFQHIETELLQISRSCHESGARLTVVCNSRRLPDDLKIIATKICRRVEADTISVDGGEAELSVLRPLLKDVLRMKLSSPVLALEDALAARTAGYASFATLAAPLIVTSWRETLTQKTAEPAIS